MTSYVCPEGTYIRSICGTFIKFIIKCGNIANFAQKRHFNMYNKIMIVNVHFFPQIDFSNKFIESILKLYLLHRHVFRLYEDIHDNTMLFDLIADKHKTTLDDIDKVAYEYSIYRNGFRGKCYEKIYKAVTDRMPTRYDMARCSRFCDSPVILTCVTHELYAINNIIKCTKCDEVLRICDENEHIYDHYIDDNHNDFYRCRICKKIKSK